MTFLTGLLVFLHLVGAAIIVGTWIYTMKRPTVSPGQFHASLLSLVTGLLLVAVHEMGEADVNHAKVAVKLLSPSPWRSPPSWASGGPGAGRRSRPVSPTPWAGWR